MKEAPAVFLALAEQHCDLEKRLERTASPGSQWHMAQIDVKHALGQCYLHYEMSDIEHVAVSLKLIHADILSISFRVYSEALMQPETLKADKRDG